MSTTATYINTNTRVRVLATYMSTDTCLVEAIDNPAEQFEVDRKTLGDIVVTR